MLITKPDQKINVLVVDDEALIREALVDFLKYMEIFNHIIEAADGLEAIRKFRNQEFDLVVTDLTMPKASGIDLIKAIKDYEKNNPQNHPTSIVILSGNLTDIGVKQAVQLGVKHALTKPCRSEDFVKKIEQIVLREHPKKVEEAEKQA